MTVTVQYEYPHITGNNDRIAHVTKITITEDFNWYKDLIKEDICRYLFGLQIDNSRKDTYAVSSEVLDKTLCLTIQGRECFLERSVGLNMEVKVIHGNTTKHFTEITDKTVFFGVRVLDLVDRTAHYITSQLVTLKVYPNDS